MDKKVNNKFESMNVSELINYISKRSTHHGETLPNHTYCLNDFMNRYGISSLSVAKKQDLLEYVCEMQKEDWTDAFSHLIQRNI